MSSNIPIWQPDAQRIQQSHLFSFQQFLKTREEPVKTDNYAMLHQWSVEYSKEFWQAIWSYCDVIGFQGDCLRGEGKPKWGKYQPNRDTVWFPQARLNYAENLLSYAYQKPDGIAIWFKNERGQTRKITWQELCDKVSCVQQWLVQNDVKQGDVVAAYLPHIPEAVIAMLATTSLGAIWTSTSPDFGVDSVVERFQQVGPKVMFCCDGYCFRGKSFSLTHKNIEIASKLTSLTNVCQIDYLQSHATDISGYEHFSLWQAIISSYTPTGLSYARVNFNSPVFILYSSGTTGKPKCIVHSVGGTLLNHLKEHQLHCDVKPDDRVFYYTSCGWMMWNWHVSALGSGATLVIYDGCPSTPMPSVLWELAEEAQVTLFGTSAKYLESIQQQGFEPGHYFDLHQLKTICSTGSVLYPEQYDYVYSHIRADIHLASISGGTDICGCFVLGNPISPVYRGEVQGAALGLDIDVYAESTLPQTMNSNMEVRGELVCKNSFPNQPLGFWHDDGQKYHKAYWSKFEGVWHHGDEVTWTQNKGMIFYGRSDTVLNPGGVRIGTAEIYRCVNAIPEITDSIVVGREIRRDEHIVLFVQVEAGQPLSKHLEDKIKQKLRLECSPRHVPKEIYAVTGIPRTRSGKLVELAVKQLIHGNQIQNESAIANPETLSEFLNYSQPVTL